MAIVYRIGHGRRVGSSCQVIERLCWRNDLKRWPRGSGVERRALDSVIGLSLLPGLAPRLTRRLLRSLLAGRLPRRLPLGGLAGLLLGALRRRRLARSAGGLAGSRAAARPAASFRPAHFGLGAAARAHFWGGRSARQFIFGHSQTAVEIVLHDAPSNLRVSIESLSLTKHTADVKQTPAVAWAAAVPALWPGIEVENRLDRAATHGTEGHAIAT